MSTNIQKQQPLSGQESVWDYPRPPRLEPTSKHIYILFNGERIADTTRAFRVLETSHPPIYYIPPADIHMEYFTATNRSTFCEFKGAASYWTIKLNDRLTENAAWSYSQPAAGYEAIKNYLAFYPGKVDACYVNDELVQAQEGDFYGGWITREIVGPFKGGAGTWGW
jgi:uncharacterized protein (DUF427 family)